jgi:hypothetical protein
MVSIFFSMVFVTLNANACSYPEPPSFATAIKSASNVFVFQLMAAKVMRWQDGEVYSEWVEGSIRPVTDFKGKSMAYKTIEFSSRPCGGLNLNVGHYFLIVTNQSSEKIELRPDDQSILDITGSFTEHVPEANENVQILNSIKSALAGESGFESIDADRYNTSIIPPPCVCQ